MIEDFAQSVRSLVGLVPPPVFVFALLAGPTVAWLGYRSMASRRSPRSVDGAFRGVPIEAEYWQCPDCLSLTPMTRTSCYSCGFEPGLDDVEDTEERAPVGAGAPGREQELLPRG